MTNEMIKDLILLKEQTLKDIETAIKGKFYGNSESKLIAVRSKLTGELNSLRNSLSY